MVVPMDRHLERRAALSLALWAVLSSSGCAAINHRIDRLAL